MAHNLSSNISRCKVMYFRRKRHLFTFDYTVNNNLLSSCVEPVDPGVHIEAKLTFALHINRVVKSCHKLLSFIVRNTRDCSNVQRIFVLYYKFSRSKLDCCATI